MAPPNVKIKHLTRSPSSSGDTRFPKLDECAHFHYENVELGPIKVLLCDRQTNSSKGSIMCNSSANKENETDRLCFLVTVVSNSKKWMVRRSYRNFMFLDTQLHRCVYDRKYSLLLELPNLSQDDSDNENFEEQIRNRLSEYLERFSQLAGSLINCGPVLNWFELDNRGNRLIVTDEVAINTPAVAAAYVVVPYSALATDEISFDIGDMISVIDMPPPEESSWWRGKKGFEVGFFPSECVEVIGDKVPHSFKLSNSSTKPVFRRHGKLIAFFRSFLLSRPSRRKLKQSGILKERVFGCDLGEHLLNTGREIPMVLKCCSEFIEEYGIVDGIYRLSGVSSNIQRLRLAFDEDRPINLGDPSTVHDIHSVASLLKMYFRELPNPLLTYQLYDKFVSAVQCNEEVRLLRVRDIVQQLPPPHFRTLQYLLRHLAHVASYGEQTGMTPKNIAIVWAPNLLRSRDVENGGVGALHVVGVQAVLTEYLIRFSDLIFDEKVAYLSGPEEGMQRVRPKSLAISTPTKLLSLEEARARALSTHLPPSQQKYIEVGGGPDRLPSKYHTVIELPGKMGYSKLKKSPSGWKSFFSRGWYSGSTRDKNRPSFRTFRKASTGSLPHHSAFMPEKPSIDSETSCSQRKKLRTVKSAESLVRCVKEVSQATSNEDDSEKVSQKLSSLASPNSATSLETSPICKSNGLKHTRSSSHESYFDGSNIDVLSDPPSFEEDEHSLFYYVSEQMRKLQNWDNKLDSVSMKSADVNDASTAYTKTGDLEQAQICQKQKASDSDAFAQAKVQKPSPGATSKSSKSDFHEDEIMTVQDNCEFEFGSSKHDLSLDPITLYESVVNKRESSASSSDEVDTNRTIVERYGTAETVLVEVHATQGSSSEEEISSPTGGDDSVFYNESELEDIKNIHNLMDNTGTDTENSLAVINECEDKNEVSTHADDNSVCSKLANTNSNCDSFLDMDCENTDSISEPSLSPINISEIWYKNLLCSELSVTSEVENHSTSICESPCIKSAVEEDNTTNDRSHNAVFSINVPPSPVFPPKSLKLHKFESPRTKHNIPASCKKNKSFISSPSSPVEEVRKKFELHTSYSRGIAESSSDVKYRFQEKETSKVVKSGSKSKNTSNETINKIEALVTINEDTALAKRHSEPPQKATEVGYPIDIVKRMSNKYESESSRVSKVPPADKPKASQPSLFTQLKIRKLQSLQADSSPTHEPVDPWSDPILDMQEDYHPIVTYQPQLEKETKSDSIEVKILMEDVAVKCVDESVEEKVKLVDGKEDSVNTRDLFTEETVCVKLPAVCESDHQPSLNLKMSDAPEDEAVKRERINRIKEERRAQLREKLKQESFRMEAEEKEKVQTKFRLRKECTKHGTSSENIEEVSVNKSDKSVETDSANIMETGTNCDLNSFVAIFPKSPTRMVGSSSPNKKDLSPKQLPAANLVLVQNKAIISRKVDRSYEDTRKWLSMPPTDIRDKVAMFERSKDKELCRLGPSGKFPQKQSPSALASSYVR